MSLLFTLLVLLGFIAMLIHKTNISVGLTPLPEWPAWAFWTVAALIWAIPALG